MKTENVIYAIRNLVNNKLYVGSAVWFERRRQQHLFELRKNIHHSAYLQNSWNKHGESNFVFEILERVENSGLLIETEQKWMELTNCVKRDSGYNVCPIAGSNLGVVVSERGRRNLSLSKMGDKNPNYGKSLSKEARRKKSESQIGEKNHMFGKKHSEETKRKMRNVVRRNTYVQTDEHRLKIREAQTKTKREKSKLTEDMVREIRRLRATGMKMRIIGEMFEITEGHVQKIVYNYIWKEV